MKKLLWLSAILLTPLALAGCQKALSQSPGGGPPGSKPAPAVVYVAHPEVQQVTDYEDFTGHFQAQKRVEIRARVSGYLQKLDFVDGSHVDEGAVLFEIDPRPFAADLASKEALLAQAESHADRLKADLNRAETLLPTKAISQETYDQRRFDYLEGLASIQSLKAIRDQSKLMLDFTKVTAPISGLVSRRLLDIGNMVKADDTMLTTIVSQDPIYAYFDVDENTKSRIDQLKAQGKLPTKGPIKGVRASLSSEKDFSKSRIGDIDFVETQIDSQTGTQSYRATFPNPNNYLTPGAFVRIRVPIGEAHQAVVIPESALGMDQGRKFVYVVDAQNKVVYRTVQVGVAVEGGKCVINEGLAATDTFIVSGLQRVRPDAEVAPQPAEKAAAAVGPPTTAPAAEHKAPPPDKVAPPADRVAPPVEKIPPTKT